MNFDPTQLAASLDHYWPRDMMTQAAWTLGGAVVFALFALFFLRTVARRIVTRTATDLDDKILAAIERPVVWTILAGGVWYAIGLAKPPEYILYVSQGILMSAVVVSWTWTGAQVVDLLLNAIVAAKDRTTLVNARTVPLFKMVGKGALMGFTAYFFFLAWKLDLSAWLASAGVIGIAVGFAAQDSLANLFAGVSIIADAPYKLGDHLEIDAGIRGKVVEIGIRSTRIQTLDDTMIIVPNSIMASARILNESAGPQVATRVSTTVECSYEADIDQVREVLMGIGRNLHFVTKKPAPQVHFTEFGASGLVFQLRVWVIHPQYRAKVLDAMNTAIYKQFATENLEIPYSKHDVYLHRVADKSEASE